jgi:hypothetical protein
MNIERAALQGELAEAREKHGRLHLTVEGLCGAIRQGLNPILTPPEQLEMEKMDALFDELKIAWAELLLARQRIGRLEKALA